MGVLISEVGYTSAMPRREDHEVHKDMWWHRGKNIRNLIFFVISFNIDHISNVIYIKGIYFFTYSINSRSITSL